MPTCFQNVIVGQPGGVISQLQGLGVPVSATHTLICWLLCKQVRTWPVKPCPECPALRDLQYALDVPPVYPTSVALTPGNWLKTASCTADPQSCLCHPCIAVLQGSNSLDARNSPARGLLCGHAQWQMPYYAWLLQLWLQGC